MREALGDDPYTLLVAVMLSARSKDTMTIPVSQKLFTLAGTPQAIVKLSRERIEKVLRPIGFYRQKARYVHTLSRQLLDRFDGRVPATREELTMLSGVGRKTANIMLSQYFRKPAIAVDTHVHRISNRLGWVRTRKPAATERELAKIVPRRFWHGVNHVFVRHGQEICLPRTPRCRECPVYDYCRRVGGTQSG